MLAEVWLLMDEVWLLLGEVSLLLADIMAVAGQSVAASGYPRWEAEVRLESGQEPCGNLCCLPPILSVGSPICKGVK
jgi:hypothetical protein